MVSTCSLATSNTAPIPSFVSRIPRIEFRTASEGHWRRNGPQTELVWDIAARLWKANVVKLESDESSERPARSLVFV